MSSLRTLPIPYLAILTRLFIWWLWQVYIWNRQSTRLIEVFPGHKMTVNCVSWNPTRHKMLASASDDHTIRIWAPATKTIAWRARLSKNLLRLTVLYIHTFCMLSLIYFCLRKCFGMRDIIHLIASFVSRDISEPIRNNMLKRSTGSLFLKCYGTVFLASSGYVFNKIMVMSWGGIISSRLVYPAFIYWFCFPSILCHRAKPDLRFESHRPWWLIRTALLSSQRLGK